jgi:hypothetical protein
LVTARCTEAHWSKVPSFGNDFKKVKSPSWRDLRTFCVQISTMANTLTFPAASSLQLKPPTSVFLDLKSSSFIGKKDIESKKVLKDGSKKVFLRLLKSFEKGDFDIKKAFSLIINQDTLSVPEKDDVSKNWKRERGFTKVLIFEKCRSIKILFSKLKTSI